MPSFQIQETVTIEADFEVYCGTCGEGLCNQSSAGKTNRRGYPYVTVDACSKCLERARDEGADSRSDEVSRLKDEITDLRRQLEDTLRELDEERNG